MFACPGTDVIFRHQPISGSFRPFYAHTLFYHQPHQGITQDRALCRESRLLIPGPLNSYIWQPFNFRNMRERKTPCHRVYHHVLNPFSKLCIRFSHVMGERSSCFFDRSLDIRCGCSDVSEFRFFLAPFNSFYTCE